MVTALPLPPCVCTGIRAKGKQTRERALATTDGEHQKARREGRGCKVCGGSRRGCGMQEKPNPDTCISAWGRRREGKESTGPRTIRMEAWGLCAVGRGEHELQGMQESGARPCTLPPCHGGHRTAQPGGRDAAYQTYINHIKPRSRSSQPLAAGRPRMCPPQGLEAPRLWPTVGPLVAQWPVAGHPPPAHDSPLLRARGWRAGCPGHGPAACGRAGAMGTSGASGPRRDLMRLGHPAGIQVQRS